MAINLEKGQRINLEKDGGQKLTNFCVGCNWGAIVTKVEIVDSEGFLGLGRKTHWGERETDVDVDLSCIMTDSNGQLIDGLYSSQYRQSYFTNWGLPVGKDWSDDKAMYHTPDDTKGDSGGDDGLDNEIITVDLSKVNPKIAQIIFFLNIYKPTNVDFQQIPYVSIRMFEGTPEKVNSIFAQYDVAKDALFAGKDALIMGKLVRKDGDWSFAAIGDAFADKHDMRNTIKRILTSYTK